MATISMVISSSDPILIAHCRAPAFLRHRTNQLLPGSTLANVCALARKGAGSGGVSIPSIRPRTGSRARHMARASGKPGSAASRNANCQPEKPRGAVPGG